MWAGNGPRPDASRGGSLYPTGPVIPPPPWGPKRPPPEREHLLRKRGGSYSGPREAWLDRAWCNCCSWYWDHRGFCCLIWAFLLTLFGAVVWYLTVFGGDSDGRNFTNASLMVSVPSPVPNETYSGLTPCECAPGTGWCSFVQCAPCCHEQCLTSARELETCENPNSTAPETNVTDPTYEWNELDNCHPTSRLVESADECQAAASFLGREFAIGNDGSGCNLAGLDGTGDNNTVVWGGALDDTGYYKCGMVQCVIDTGRPLGYGCENTQCICRARSGMLDVSPPFPPEPPPPPTPVAPGMHDNSMIDTLIEASLHSPSAPPRPPLSPGMQYCETITFNLTEAPHPPYPPGKAPLPPPPAAPVAAAHASEPTAPAPHAAESADSSGVRTLATASPESAAVPAAGQPPASEASVAAAVPASPEHSSGDVHVVGNNVAPEDAVCTPGAETAPAAASVATEAAVRPKHFLL